MFNEYLILLILLHHPIFSFSCQLGFDTCNCYKSGTKYGMDCFAKSVQKTWLDFGEIKVQNNTKYILLYIRNKNY